MLNKRLVRDCALQVAKSERPAANFTRVSPDFYAAILSATRKAIADRVRAHPSNGRTLH